jgi:hypothetical protein
MTRRQPRGHQIQALLCFGIADLALRDRLVAETLAGCEGAERLRRWPQAAQLERKASERSSRE